MARSFKMIIICVLFLIVAVPASSELYQYQDQNGITRLTDNIYSVPVKYRSQLEAYSEIESLSNKMEIQPLEKKSSPQAKKEKLLHRNPTKQYRKTLEKKLRHRTSPGRRNPLPSLKSKNRPPLNPFCLKKLFKKRGRNLLPRLN